MTSFATITLEEYQKLVDNEKKIFDLTENFTTPEILNKYRNTDRNVEDKIKLNEMTKEKYENLDKIINKSIDKLTTKPKNDFTANYDHDHVSISVLDKTEYDYYDINSKISEQNYSFGNDDEILNFFSKMLKEYDMEYNPRPNTRYYRVRYLLNKLKENKNVPIDLYNHFHTTLSENNKAYHVIPINKNEQTGSSINNIMINDKDLNKGILRARYLNNNRKLTNNLLKHDYKISEKMKKAIKFNKDIYKLSKKRDENLSRITKILKQRTRYKCLNWLVSIW